MKRVLILGGGFGGIATARRLKEKLGENDEVILVDRRANFMVGFRKTWALVGESTLEEGQRPLDGLKSLGIRVMHDPSRISTRTVAPQRWEIRSSAPTRWSWRLGQNSRRKRSLAFNSMLITFTTRMTSRVPPRY